jgi:hypothetical protein
LDFKDPVYWLCDEVETIDCRWTDVELAFALPRGREKLRGVA